jgi:hypothetical protein
MDGLIDLRPTFYEMMLLESYNQLVSDGVRHCLRVILNRYDSLVTIRYYSETIANSVLSGLDLVNFWKYGANFEESFSGLCRNFKHPWVVGFIGYIVVRLGSKTARLRF